MVAVGPEAGTAAVALARSGLMALTGWPDGPPVSPPLGLPAHLDGLVSEIERRAGRPLRISWEAALSGKENIIAELKSKLTEVETRHQALSAEHESQLAESQNKIQALFSQHQVLATAQDRLRSELEEKDQRIRETPKELARVLSQPLPHDEVVRLAHGYAAARNFVGGSEQEDWIRAENEVRVRLLKDYLSQGNSVAAGAR